MRPVARQSDLKSISPFRVTIFMAPCPHSREEIELAWAATRKLADERSGVDEAGRAPVRSEINLAFQSNDLHGALPPLTRRDRAGVGRDPQACRRAKRSR